MDPKDFEPFARYLQKLGDDPVRVAILAAHSFIEEMIESIIAQAVPNSECFDVPNMRFVDKVKVVRKLDAENHSEVVWGVIRVLNNLRAAAAHRNYEEQRDERFAELAKAADFREQDFNDRESFLRSVAAYCFGFLNGLRKEMRAGSSSAS